MPDNRRMRRAYRAGRRARYGWLWQQQQGRTFSRVGQAVAGSLQAAFDALPAVGAALATGVLEGVAWLKRQASKDRPS